jgi:glycosyltransferase involved in cell wall biosynthesis
MKILWTHNFDPSVSGSGVFMYTFAKGMADLGVIIDLMYTGPLNRISKLYDAKNKIKVESKAYDLVHAQFGSACAFVSSAAVVPKVVSLRGSDWHFYKGTDISELWHCSLANIFSIISISSFDKVITMSKRMEDSVLRWFPSSSIVTITDPVDTSIFKPIERAVARECLFSTTSNAPWVLFTSLNSLNSIKRVNLAKDAVRIASSRIPGLELKVASGVAHNLMPLFVASCNVVLCTSTHEGWPNSVKEALACGLPFVSTDVSDLAVVAARHPSCYIGSPDPAILADFIVQSLSAPLDPFLTKEVSNMSLESSCIQLESLYKDTLR